MYKDRKTKPKVKLISNDSAKLHEKNSCKEEKLQINYLLN